MVDLSGQTPIKPLDPSDPRQVCAPVILVLAVAVCYPELSQEPFLRIPEGRVTVDDELKLK